MVTAAVRIESQVSRPHRAEEAGPTAARGFTSEELMAIARARAPMASHEERARGLALLEEVKRSLPPPEERERAMALLAETGKGPMMTAEELMTKLATRRPGAGG